MKNTLRIKILCFLVLFLSFITQGCNKMTPSRQQALGSYPSALFWNGVLYQPTADKPIDKSSIKVEIGKIIGQADPMPKRNGEVNDIRDFSVGDRLFSINQVEETEAIAARKNDTYYRLDRIRSALGVIWNGREYDFVGNFDKEDEVNNTESQLGIIKGSGIDSEDLTDGDITVRGVEAESTDFPAGSKLYSLKNISLDVAIAVSDRNGKYHKALYVKRR